MNDLDTGNSLAIMIASDNMSDAGIVNDLLQSEFRNLTISSIAGNIVADFEQHRPDVIVLAFHQLDEAEACCLELYRRCAGVTQKPLGAIVLCKNDDIRRAYKLCMQKCFDDYVPFWPMAHDGLRLLMATHHAIRLLKAGITNRYNTAPIPAPAAIPVMAVLLIVDDDEFQQKILKRLFEHQPYHLVFANNGLEALSLLTKATPNLILMDINMPGIDGIEVTRRIRALPNFSNIPIIMVTGQSEGTSVRDSIRAGASAFVVKPFDRDLVLSKVASALLC